MPFWNTQKLTAACKAKKLISPFDPNAVKRCAYELSVGDEAFIPSASSENLKLEEGKGIAIPPGQFCLLITREVVEVPPDAIAFISIRAGTKLKGLVNVSGFHVDPGWKGMLKFAVYNAGSEKIHLDYGERIFLIWYADLNAATSDPRDDPAQTRPVISSSNRNDIDGELASPAELKKQLDELKADMKERFHAAEQNRLFNRHLGIVILSVLGALCVGVLTWTVIKPLFDRQPTPTANPQAVAPGDATSGPKQPPEEGRPAPGKTK
jgi:dCTP deaminase